MLALDAGWRARVALVAPGVGRVLLLPPAGLREPRTWAVIDGQPRDPWRGADRSALFPAAPEATSTRDPAGLTLADDQLRVRIATRPLRSDLGAVRRQHLAALLRRPPDLRLWQRTTQRPHGPLAAARRARPVLRPRRQDRPAEQGGAPLSHQRHSMHSATTAKAPIRSTSTGPSSSVAAPTPAAATASTTTRWPSALSISAQEFDNYHGFYRATEIADGDLDCYVFAGPDIARRTGALRRADRRHRDAAALEPGLRQHRDGASPTRPTRRRASREFLATREALTVPALEFPLRLGLHQPRQAALRVHLEPRQVPRSAARCCRRFRDAGVRTVANLKPCLLDDHPAFESVAAEGGFIREEGGAVCLDPFWDGWGAHLDFTREGDRALVAGQPAAAGARRRLRRRLERQQRVPDLERGRRHACRRRAAADPPLAAAARRC